VVFVTTLSGHVAVLSVYVVIVVTKTTKQRVAFQQKQLLKMVKDIDGNM
jgi:hypothetical protein